MKKCILACVLAIIMLAALEPMTPGVPATANDMQEDGGQRSWFWSSLDEDEAKAVPGYSSVPASLSAPSKPPLDMSVYDVAGFSNNRWDSKKNDDDDIVEVLSAYEAADYVMYRIMTTDDDETGWRDGIGGYTATFRVDTDDGIRIPWWASERYAQQIAGRIGGFIHSYFPHEFNLTATATAAIDADGFEHLDTITIELTPANQLKVWIEEYSESKDLIEEQRNVASFLKDGYTYINDGNNNQKLKNVHSYLHNTTTYGGGVFFGAYTVLINKRGVCGDWSRATTMLCLRMGLNIPYVAGVVQPGFHAWNLNLENFPEILVVDLLWSMIDHPMQTDRRIYNRFLISWITYVNNGREHDNLDKGLIFHEIAKNIDAFTIRSTGTPVIYLAEEEINLAGFQVAAYSLDGGAKWKNKPLPNSEKIKKFFDKGMTLHLKSEANDIVAFPKINARPKAKYRPNYSALTWTIVDKKDKSETSVSENVEYADTWNRRDRLGDWKDMPDGGFLILSGKKRILFFVRIPPRVDSEGFTPASKTMRIKPANYRKAPKYKFNTKKGDVITLKKGDVWAVDSNNFSAPLTEKEVFKREDFVGSVLYVKNSATGKKPESAVKEISIR